MFDDSYILSLLGPLVAVLIVFFLLMLFTGTGLLVLED